MGAIDKALREMIGAAPTPLGTGAMKSAAWDNAGADAIALGAGARFVHLFTTEDAYIVTNTTAVGDPPVAGAVYAKLQTHAIPCVDGTYLHYKGLTANGTIYVTVFSKST